ALSLEDGLRLAVALSGPEAALPQVAVNRPSTTMVSSVTGVVLQPSDILDNTHWRKLTGDTAAFETCLEALAGTGVELVAEIGGSDGAGTAAGQWPSGGPDAAAATFVDRSSSFPDAVARAYEAGASVAFAGLFAGETRRRVSIPGYAFQRRSLWVQSR
ncbi:MAG: hypothetical protein OXC99_00485, partial [Chloroflexi bacterium]|nr:hypothetical protein [Chloroflexota bacterium]